MHVFTNLTGSAVVSYVVRAGQIKICEAHIGARCKRLHGLGIQFCIMMQCGIRARAVRGLCVAAELCRQQRCNQSIAAVLLHAGSLCLERCGMLCGVQSN